MIERWDTLYYQMIPDSVRYGVADRAMVDSSPEQLTSSELFGPLAEDATHLAQSQPFVDALVDNTLYQTIVLILIAGYMLLVCANIRSIASLFSRESMGGSPSGRGGGKTFTAALVMGLVTITLVGVRLSEQLPARELGCMTLMLMLTAAWIFVLLAQLGLVWIIGRVTLTSDLSSALVASKAQYFSLASIVAVPLSLLYVLSPVGSGEWWIWIAGVVIILAVLMFLKDSFQLFMSKKVSILHWFLYLCCVEIWPISLVWTLVNR